MKSHILRKLCNTITFNKLYGNPWDMDGNLRKFIEHHSNFMYLAGGSLRDTVLGGDIKDYDFFINVKDFNEDLAFKAGFITYEEFLSISINEADNALISACEDGKSKEVTQEFYDISCDLSEELSDIQNGNFDSGKNIIDVYKKLDGKLSDIVVVRSDVLSHIQGFGTFLSQIYIDLKEPNKVQYTKGFEQDLKNKTLTINPYCIESKLDKYIGKIVNKYPNRKLIKNLDREKSIELIQTITC